MPIRFTYKETPLASSKLNAAFDELLGQVNVLASEVGSYTFTLTTSAVLAALNGQTIVASLTGNASTATKLAAAQNITMTGAVTGSGAFDGSGTTTIATTLATSSLSGVTAGTYNNISVDVYGRVLTARVFTSLDITTALGFTPLSTLTDITGNAATATKLAASKTITISGDASSSAIAFDGSANITLATALTTTSVTAGTYNNITVDAKGRLTSARNINSADITTALGFTPAQPPSATVPSTATSTGIQGQVAFDDTHIYVCIETNSWTRVAMAAW